MTKTDSPKNSTNLFLWLRRDVDKLKCISDYKNYAEIYAASSTRQDGTKMNGTKMLFEDIQNTFNRLS